MMKNACFYKTFLIYLIFLLGMKSYAWEGEADLTYSSSYVTHGLVVVSGPVLQPKVSFTQKGFKFLAWGNYNLADSGEFKKWHVNEVLLNLEYTHSFSKVPLECSVGEYHSIFPGTTIPTLDQLYLGLKWNTFLNPNLVVHYEFKAINGWYVSFDVSHTFEELFFLLKRYPTDLTLKGFIAFGDEGFNDFLYNSPNTGFDDVVLTMELPIRLANHSKIIPFVSAFYLIDSRHRAKQEKDHLVWGGITYRYMF